MGADSIDLVKSKLALVRMLTVGHANCINTLELKSRGGGAPVGQQGFPREENNKWLERNASPVAVGEQSKYFGMRQALPFSKQPIGAQIKVRYGVGAGLARMQVKVSQTTDVTYDVYGGGVARLSPEIPF